METSRWLSDEYRAQRATFTAFTSLNSWRSMRQFPLEALTCGLPYRRADGVELLTTGRLSLPMREPERSYLLDVRRGKIGEQECRTRADELERELADLEATSALPEAPEEARVEEWVLDAYRRSWRE